LSSSLNPLLASEPNLDRGGDQVRFYGRRKGKPIKAGRQALLGELLPKLRLAVPERGSLAPAALFPFTPREVWLEIGFGSGEHLAGQAEAHPDVGFIGSEVFLNGVASLVRHVAERSLANVRVFDDDVRLLLPAFPPQSLARVSLLFPDPWPKTRHAKRRFISPETLHRLGELLIDGGEFRVASDHPVYVRWALAQVLAHSEFAWNARGPEDWRIRAADSGATRYEQKAVAAGRRPAYLRFFRKPRTA
jgi:tRNA (guanine-N7-)-methyltransferase